MFNVYFTEEMFSKSSLSAKIFFNNSVCKLLDTTTFIAKQFNIRWLLLKIIYFPCIFPFVLRVTCAATVGILFHRIELAGTPVTMSLLTLKFLAPQHEAELQINILSRVCVVLKRGSPS